MTTPICDFVRRYESSGTARFHMPGHKGQPVLGCESPDITEISGADSLYEADGIIAESEANASALFGSGATFYSTEGSSQCIRAMLTLAVQRRRSSSHRPVVVAGRNAHKAFVLAAALLDLDVVWLWPEEESFSLCRCPISPGKLRETLTTLPEPPVAVYVTSPDYLGGMLDISALAEISHHFDVPLLVDNAHGAYLRFLQEDCHPLTLGADLCCDSAHKTLPVLTGGAYLHVNANAPVSFRSAARQAMALFGSTSPSYLTLQSLDAANALLSGSWKKQLSLCVHRLERLKQALSSAGWQVEESDPLKLTVAAARSGWNGTDLAAALRNDGIECEYADRDYVVLMATPSNTEADFLQLESAFRGLSPAPAFQQAPVYLTPPAAICSIRQAILSPCETVAAQDALGRVLSTPTVSCPPAVPVVVSGERIDADALEIFHRCGIKKISVMCESPV